MGFLRAFETPIYGLFRIVVGFLFACHGVSKLIDYFSGAEIRLPPHLFWPTALIESVGGALVAIGLFTSEAAFLCSGLMAAAYFMQHQPQGMLPIQNGGTLAAVYSWAFLLIAARGGGAWSMKEKR